MISEPAAAYDVELDLAAWARPVDEADLALLAWCRGATLDVGCGPGRMVAALHRRGTRALGVDTAEAAIVLAEQRGAPVLRRDVFEPLPGEGTWDCVLLADGNIGLGGDPTALLLRLRRVLAPGGRVVAETAPPGTRSTSGWARLRTRAEAAEEPRFRWATLGPEALRAHAAEAGFGAAHHRAGRRWFSVLTPDASAGGPEPSRR